MLFGRANRFKHRNCIDAMCLIRKQALLEVDGYSMLSAVGKLGWGGGEGGLPAMVQIYRSRLLRRARTRDFGPISYAQKIYAQ